MMNCCLRNFADQFNVDCNLHIDIIFHIKRYDSITTYLRQKYSNLNNIT